MIKLTLTFQSVEAARKALNELPLDLFAHVGEIAPVEHAVNADEIKEAKATAQAAVQTAKKSSVKQEPAATQTTAETTAAPEPKVENSAAIEYPVLQKAVFALAGKSREAAAAVAASFGVKTFKELDASKWGDALTAVNAALAEAA